MVLAYERLEERCIDDVTNDKFCFLINKSNRFHIAVGLFRNKSQMTSNVVRISVTPGCTSCATILFLFVNKIRGMVSFKLGKDIKKDVFRLVTSVGQRKNSESPQRIEPQTFGFRALMLYHWATETLQSVRSITKVIWHASCILLGSAVRFLMRAQNFFFVPRSLLDEKHLSLFLYRAQSLPSLLFYLQTLRYRHCWSWQYAICVSYELCNRPHSP